MLAYARLRSLPRVAGSLAVPGQWQYLVMGYVEGVELQAMLERLDSPAEREALAWIDHVCGAVAYLHHHKSPVVHRDVEPSDTRVAP